MLTGPWVETCRFEAEALENAGGLQVVADAAELGTALAGLLADADLRRRRGEAAWEAAQRLTGATERTLELLDGLALPGGPALDRTAQYATVPASDSSRTNSSGASSP